MQQLGKYQLIRKLATGGMAEVFLAKAAGPMGFEKTLVVKRILPHLAEDPTFVEMFLSEAKLAAQLNHPNIVQIFDFGEADGEYFLAMEYIDGPNLRTLLKRARTAGMPLPIAPCARLIASACDGLAFAHDFADPATGEPLGLIHRDISPDNILVSRQGAVKVVDFGIAKAAGQSHKTQSGLIKGKLAYMPPEQVRARPLDRRVDVYALGVVLYELLTTHKPFESDSDAGTMQAILFEALTPAVEHRPDLPEGIQRILDKALTKDREQRYPDCLALAADLEEFILSVGKPVTQHQIVQLIAQVAPNTDAPMPTPQSGTSRGGSGSKPAATPVHTPAPSTYGTGPRSSSTPAPSPEPSMVEPVEPVGSAKPFTEPLLITRTQVLEAPSSAAQPLASAPQGEEASRKAGTPTTPSARRVLIPAVAGVALLLLGGGYLMWSGGSKTSNLPPAAPEAPRVITEAPPDKAPTPALEPTTPAPTPPAPAPSTVAENLPESPPSTTPATPPETVKPMEVAAVTPADPPKPSSPPKPRPSPGPKPSTVKAVGKGTQVVGKGTLAFRIRPFAMVFINGKLQGQTPFAPVELPAGTHSLRFVNDDLKKNVTQTVELKPGENKVIKLNLEE
jgi:serine/threonine-protein kinase